MTITPSSIGGAIALALVAAVWGVLGIFVL